MKTIHIAVLWGMLCLMSSSGGEPQAHPLEPAVSDPRPALVEDTEHTYFCVRDNGYGARGIGVQTSYRLACGLADQECRAMAGYDTICFIVDWGRLE